MNNRIIKFRAWDNKRKKMYLGVGVRDVYNVYSYNPLAEEWTRIPYKIEVMQYTGIKDKNRKEVYESDIIETKGYVTVVRYEAPSFCCRYDGGRAEMMDFDPFEECEVIGNIYQNSELLTIIN